ncbi:hypothetical protein WP12_13245 [Sphingomonas sp. SRS2]|nr:hypothetical protein WP12_13245 [Sphingomonas sp. SRS2]
MLKLHDFCNRALEQFIEIMANLDLPYPKQIDVAVPANRLCGDCRDEDTAARDPSCRALQG